MQIVFDDGSNNNKHESTTTASMDADKRYHVAVTHDGGCDVDFYVNNNRIEEDSSFCAASGFVGATDVVLGASDYDDAGIGTGHGDFDGTMVEVRIVNYERKAFGGGLMIAKVDPDTEEIIIYNSAGASVDVNGLEIWTGTGR